MPAVPSNAIATGQVTMTGAAVLIANARADRKRITLIMAGTPAPTGIGGTTAVTTANGAVLAGVAGAQLVLETAAAIYGNGAAAAVVSYIEEFA